MKILFSLRAFPPQISPSGNIVYKLVERLPSEWDISILTENVIEQNTIKKTEYKYYFVQEVKKQNKYIEYFKRNVQRTPYDKSRVDQISQRIQQLDEIHDFDYIVACTPNEIVGLANASVKAKKVMIFMEKLFNNQSLNFLNARAKKEYRNTLLYSKIIEEATQVFAFPIVYSKLIQGRDNNRKIIEIEHPLIENKISSPDLEENIFLYAGSLDRYQRNPERAVSLIEHLCNQLNWNSFWYGGGSGFKTVRDRAQHNNKINYEGLAPAKTIKEMYQKSSVLVSIGNKDPEVVPSKIFEYISTGKVILHITNVLNDPALIYLEKYPKAIIIREDFDVEIVAREINNMKNRTLTYSQLLEDFWQSTPDSVCQRVIQCLTAECEEIE